MGQRSNRYYLLFVTMLFLLLSASTLFIVFVSYDSLVSAVVNNSHKNGLEQKIRNELFTYRRFHLLQTLAWPAIVIIGALYAWLVIKRRSVIKQLRAVFTALRQTMTSLVNVFAANSRQQNISVACLLFVIVVVSVYRMVTAYLTYDEMWSYNYYTDHPFYYSFFTYNNYPLFELSTHIFKGLPLPMKVNLRLSPLIAGICACIVLYACVRRYLNDHFTGMVAIAAFACTPLTVVFTTSARGVVHELLFAIIGIFSTLFWLRNRDNKQYLIVYAIAGVAGGYSMLPHIFFLCVLVMFVCIQLHNEDRRSALLFIKCTMLVICAALVLYIPMLLITGASVLGDVVRASPSFRDTIIAFPAVMKTVLMGYVGFNYISVGMLLLTLTVMVSRYRKLTANEKPIAWLAVALPCSPVFIYLLTRYEYPGRAVPFGSLSICLLFILFTQWLQSDSSASSLRIRRIIIASALFAMFILDARAYLPVNPINKDVADVADLFMKKSVVTCYDDSKESSNFFYYYPGIEYYYRQQHRLIHFTLSDPRSMRYKPLQSAADYDCIVYDGVMPLNADTIHLYRAYVGPANTFSIWMRKRSDK